VFLYSVHISPYSHATYDTPDSRRVRKLLLSKREIKKLIGKVQEKGFALIPLKIYFKENGKAKLELGLARGKKLYDKRAAIKKKDTDRDLERTLSSY
ncbi:MAG: SsrA-binding protein, partial [Desulfobulbaceae bacterium]|nr:SsrA-binding protein [Desulfobulbaceae bacterium]